MATLPNPDRMERVASRTPGGIAQVPTMSGMSLAAGQGMEQAGREMQQFFAQEERRINTLRAEDAFSQLRNAQIELAYGQDGFINKKGGDAVKTPLLQDYTRKFTEAYEKISSGLGNEEQKQMLKRQAAVSQAQYTQGILQHLNQENRVYRKEVLEGTILTETRNATTQWNDPYSVQASIERIKAVAADYADSEGMPQEKVDALIQQETGKIHAGVIGQAIANKNYVYAKEWFEANKGDIDPTTSKQLAIAVEGAKQKQLADGYTSQFLTFRNSQQGLNELERKVLEDNDLDETRKNMLVGRIQSRMEMLDRRAERVSAQVDRTIQKAINGLNQLSMAGFEPTMEQMEPVINMARGTQYEPEVVQMVQTANATRVFRNSTPQQQQTYLVQLEAAARKDPTKFDVTMISRFRSIHEGQQAVLKEDPVSFAVRQGLIDQQDTAAKPLDLSKPAEMGEQLSARFQLARDMASRYQSPFKPLLKEEADALVGAIGKATPVQKSKYFADLYTASKTDPEGYKAIMRQIASDEPVTAIAGLYAGRGYTTESGAGQAKMVSDLILRGQSILRPNRKEDGTPDQGKLWPMPKEDELRKLFINYERDAFAGMPTARSDLYQAAKAIYAAKISEAGDTTGILDSDIWKESMKLATGGIDRYNGKSIVLPWGRDYRQFKDGLYSRIDNIVGGKMLDETMTASRVKNLPLESVGDGKYVFRSGDGILVDKQGRPVMIDFNKSPQESSGKVQ